jgi:MtrB/PioB family decaheme-associated outer membrane protein
VLASLTPGVMAADSAAPPEGWCAKCVPAEGWEVDIKAGSLWVSDDEFAFGDYTGLDDNGFYAAGDALALYRDNAGNYVNFEAYLYSPDSLGFFIEGGRQSIFELRAGYQAIPRRFFDATTSPYLGNGSALLTLPDTWVRAPNTQSMTALTTTLAPVTIERDWDIYRFGADYVPASNWTLRTDYKHTDRQGQQRSAASFLFGGVEFAGPVDYSSDDLELEVAYATERWQSSLTYYGSVFSNADNSVQLANPFTSGTGAATGELALPPDNESHQLALAGAVVLPMRTTLNGQLSYGHMTQNERLLPYTTNGLLGAGALPASSANTEVDLLNANIRAVTSPTRQLTLEGEFRYNDFNNKTPVSTYNYVNTDSVLAPNSVTNSAYDYERRTLLLRGDYRLNSNLKLNAGVKNERVVRNRSDRTRTTTDRAWVGLRSRLGNTADVTAEVFSEDRGGSDYTTIVNPAAQENPLMRKYNLADRERRGLRLSGSSYRLEGVDIGWEFEYSQDDYAGAAIGLLETQYLRAGADVSLMLIETASLYASFYTEHIENDQANSQTFSLPDWTATTDDTFSTTTFGINAPELLGTLDATLEYTWSRSVGETSSVTNGLANSFPDLRTKEHQVRAGLSYPYSAQLSFGLDYQYENLDSADWSLDGVDAATIANFLALGADPWNYQVSVVYLSVRYALQPD